MASIWEIAIKISLGKLSLRIEFGTLDFKYIKEIRWYKEK
jgi:PIN domain nuclease of toxin-antitoxin system